MADASLPLVSLSHLDELWFQVAGTRCNLTCTHCFISCSPHNQAFGYLSLAQVRERLMESVALGVKEYYFTGGEPFLNPELTEILCETLHYGPATVLTNGTVLKNEWLSRLAAAEQASLYSLEFRVSIDGCTPQMNDPIRGAGTFARALAGVGKLVAYGFLPIITAARVWPEEEDQAVLAGFVNVLKEHGYTRPRIKLLPRLKIGAEAQRTGGYASDERITPELLIDFDLRQLVCEHSRIVTDRGVHVCPILIESEESVLGQTLSQSLGPIAVRHGACYTCYQHGAICANVSGAVERLAK